ncbi:MAG: hypothetical protein ABEJ06_04865 [Haloarculaceae archaeon]
MSRFVTVERLRQPEYTGANRCVPCTVVNGAIALAIAVGLGALWVPLGGLALVVAAATIYLRGYLVPGTPQLTERYLPEPVLAWFERRKGVPEPPDVDTEDVESALLALGVVEECREGTDLCLDDAFREAWHEEIDHLEAVGTEREDLATLLETDAEITFHEPYDQGFVARADNYEVGQWESEAAFLADLGAARVLDREAPEWQGFDVTTKGELLNGLRLFLESCPACGGPVSLGEETVRSCCRSHDVVAATCEECGARLFEARL